jgi:serine/threonine protein kinase
MNTLEIIVIVIAAVAGTLLIVLITICVIRSRIIEVSPVEIPLLSQQHGRGRASTAPTRTRASTIYADVPFPDEIPRSSFAEAVFVDIGTPKQKNHLIRTRRAKVGHRPLVVLTVSISGMDRETMEKYILAGENVVYLLSKRSIHLVQFLHISPTAIGSELRLFHETLPLCLKDIIANYRSDNRRFSTAAIEKISLGVLEGLAALHHQAPPMLHGNLAIDQIFVDIDATTGAVERVKINPPAHDNPWIVQSECYQITLSPELMSLRQSGNQNVTTFMADMFSFGLVLFELISLRSPYTDMDPPAIKKALSQGRRPSFPANVNFADYYNLISVFQDCTEMEPWYRPSAANLLRDPRLRHSRTKGNAAQLTV